MSLSNPSSNSSLQLHLLTSTQVVLSMQGEHHQDSPARSLKRPAPPESTYTSSPPHQPAASTSADTYTAPGSAGPNGQPAKKKITRRRQVLSCRNCTVRCARRLVRGRFPQTETAFTLRASAARSGVRGKEDRGRRARRARSVERATRAILEALLVRHRPV